jgi:hypothetical protein
MSESAGTNLGRLNTQRNLLLKLDPQKRRVQIFIRNASMSPMLLVMPVLEGDPNGSGLTGRTWWTACGRRRGHDEDRDGLMAVRAPLRYRQRGRVSQSRASRGCLGRDGAAPGDAVRGDGLRVGS